MTTTRMNLSISTEYKGSAFELSACKIQKQKHIFPVFQLRKLNREYSKAEPQGAFRRIVLQFAHIGSRRLLSRYLQGGTDTTRARVRLKGLYHSDTSYYQD